MVRVIRTGADLSGGRASITQQDVAFRLGTVYNITTEAAVGGVVLSMREVIQQAAETAVGESGELLRAFAVSLRNDTRRLRDRRLTSYNQRAANLSRQTLINTYQRQTPNKPGADISPTRVQYANGALLRALSDPKQYLVRWDGVAFVNRAILDKEARQWYRLNFGTVGPNQGMLKAGASPRPAYIKFFNSTIQTVDINQFNKPSRRFRLPKNGLWRAREGGPLPRTSDYSNFSVWGGRDPSRTGKDEFVFGWNETTPEVAKFLGAQDNRILATQLEKFQRQKSSSTVSDYVFTKGISPKYYLNAAVRTLARELGRGWTEMFGLWVEEALVEGSTSPVALAAQKGRIDPDIQILYNAIKSKANELDRVI